MENEQQSGLPVRRDDEEKRPVNRGRVFAGAVAAVVAVAVGIGALLAAGITPSRVLHKFSEPTASPVVSGATHLTSVASTSRWNWWQEAWKSWRKHPAVGTAKSIANPIRFSNTPVSYRVPPPMLGKHTAEILRSLGYSEEEVRAMTAKSAT